MSNTDVLIDIIEKEREYDKQQEEFKRLLEDLLMEQREQM